MPTHRCSDLASRKRSSPYKLVHVCTHREQSRRWPPISKTQIANTVRSTQLGTDHTCGRGNPSLGVKGNQKFLQQQCHYEFLLY